MRRLFAILLVKDQPGQGNLQSLGNPQKTQTFLPARSGEKWPPVPAETRVLAIYEPETWQDPNQRQPICVLRLTCSKAVSLALYRTATGRYARGQPSI